MSAQIIPFPGSSERRLREHQSTEGGLVDAFILDASCRLLDEMFAKGIAWKPATPEWEAHVTAVYEGRE